MTKKPPISPKEARLVKAVVEGANQTEAGLAADSDRTPESARVWANKALQKATVQEALHMEMAKQGITLEKIVKPIADALEAEKVHIVGNGDQAMAEVMPDHSIRLKASSMAQDLMGLKKNQEAPAIHFHQHIEEKKAEYDI